MIALLKLVSKSLAALPVPLAVALGRGVGLIFGSVVRHHRKDAQDALERSFPEKSPREIRSILQKMYSNLGIVAVETLRLPYVSEDYLQKHIEWKGRNNLEEALKEGRGALVMTGHLDNWELVSAISPKELEVPAAVVAKEIKGGVAQTFMEWLRSRYGLRILPAKKSYRKCLEALKRNELLGFVIDQNMIDREGEFVDFFGRPASTTLGLAHLASRSGAPVVPVIPVRTKGGYHEITFLPPLDPPASSDKKDLVAATQEYTRIIENAIRDNPDQWIWIHRRWKTIPRWDNQV